MYGVKKGSIVVRRVIEEELMEKRPLGRPKLR